MFFVAVVLAYLYQMILVTGGTGLVGSHLLLHLIKGNSKLRALYRNKSSIAKAEQFFISNNAPDLFKKIEWVEADLNDVTSLKLAFANVEYVYHCAGLISFDPADELKLRKINIEGTANIVNFCIDFKVKKLCHVSSIAALGHLAPHESEICETAEWNPEKPNSDYAISKYGAEMEVWRGHFEGLKVIIVNPGVIFGTGFFETGSNTFFSKINNGISFYTKGSTGYVDVEDVVNIMMQLMQSEISGERFILVSENRTYKSIFDAIAMVLKAKKPKYYANSFLTTIYWRLDGLKCFLFRARRTFTKYNALSAHNTDIISNNKVIGALDYKFKSVAETINEVGINFNQMQKLN